MDEDRHVKTILDNELVSLRYYPQKKIVHHEFRRFVYGDELREVLEKGLDAFKKYGACKWLSDDRGNGATTPEDAEWATNNWAPRVIAAGWKYWALVMPKKVVGQMSMKRWISMYAKKGVTVQVFAEPAEAMAWLESR